MTKFKSRVEFRFDVNSLKQSRPGFVPEIAVVERYDTDRRICPVVALLEYLKRTGPKRGAESKVLISYCKPYQRVSRDTISRWIKTGLAKAGIDVSIFKAHSVRAASTSKAHACQVPIDHILKKGGWSNAKTFAKFYHKPIVAQKDDFQRALLSS